MPARSTPRPAATTSPKIPIGNSEINPSDLKGLRGSWRRKQLVVFLGAGVSLPYGLPSWRNLVLDLLFEQTEHTKALGSIWPHYRRALAEWMMDYFDYNPLVLGRMIERDIRNGATRSAILAKLSSGRYDIVHYSGHAYFDAKNRDTCGLICANDEVLTGKDIERIAKLPFLILLNACQTTRTRGRAPKIKPSAPRTIAETMLCSGIANFIGTYWPVDDANACLFAGHFYAALIENKSLGDAMIAGRTPIMDRKEDGNDWANYVLFGNPAARLDSM